MLGVCRKLISMTGSLSGTRSFGRSCSIARWSTRQTSLLSWPARGPLWSSGSVLAGLRCRSAGEVFGCRGIEVSPAMVAQLRRREGAGVQTNITCGSELVIYVRPKRTDSRELLLSSVVSVSETYRRGSKITVAPRALNQAANGTHAFRVGSITSCRRSPAAPLLHSPSSSTAAVRNRWLDHTSRPAASASVATCAALHARSIPSVKSYSPINLLAIINSGQDGSSARSITPTSR